MSMLSLLPDTNTAGRFASTAIVGSFCLFWENGAVGLPRLTRTSGVSCPSAAVAASRTQATATGIAESLVI